MYGTESQCVAQHHRPKVGSALCKMTALEINASCAQYCGKRVSDQGEFAMDPKAVTWYSCIIVA